MLAAAPPGTDLGKHWKVKRTQLQILLDQGYTITTDELPLMTASREQMTAHYEAMRRQLATVNGKKYITFLPSMMSRIYLRRDQNGKEKAHLVYYDNNPLSFSKSDFSSFQILLYVFLGMYQSTNQQASSYLTELPIIYGSDRNILLSENNQFRQYPASVLDSVTLILRGNPTPGPDGTKEKLQTVFKDLTIRVYMVDDLMCNPQRHNFAPLCHKLTTDERVEYMRGKRIAQIPMFHREPYGTGKIIDDPLAKASGWEQGDIIRITKEIFYTETTHHEVANYRVVNYFNRQ